MFEAKPEYQEKVGRLLVIAESVQRGTVLEWERVEDAIELDRESDLFWYIVGRFRRIMLKERQIAMRPEINLGLKFLTPTEQVHRCSEDRRMKMFRQSTRAMREIGAVQANSLNMQDRKLRLSQIDRLKAERREIRQSLREVRWTQKPAKRKEWAT